jgi:hypothetical protein
MISKSDLNCRLKCIVSSLIQQCHMDAVVCTFSNQCRRHASKSIKVRMLRMSLVGLINQSTFLGMYMQLSDLDFRTTTTCCNCWISTSVIMSRPVELLVEYKSPTSVSSHKLISWRTLSDIVVFSHHECTASSTDTVWSLVLPMVSSVMGQ